MSCCGVLAVVEMLKKGKVRLVIGLDESGYQVNSFLISQRKHMLWVLTTSASPRRF